MSRSHAISDFAEANRRIALKQYLTPVNLARLPKEEDINEMLRNQEIVKQLLQQVNSLQSSLRTQSGPGPPQEHMVGLSATRPMIAPTEAAKPELNSGRLYAEVAILSRQDRELHKASDVIGLSEA
ncbi:hypothetical protein J7337_003701 [Fusarium musae]|uniref:Uncharacterized protein n=1 Tax=Fusarium musae TaxID=1042133 RepID=A0A9P8DLP1_9HYPO|nr:hypothetical protein J7337_003701 [Fusarium musae]KAG9503746.1 hypothetical protein J7337_003701 [Fusarium musae]